ncbi:zinc finger protein 585A-like isoform X2 [Zootermopsis nevadensis]|uniref:zinc finger protein 585A-like isoform X2 n=1 Tax=Zootermopsis nevadensis TaxID=136037 RepID=UPI000B8E3C84|nr:zinc finger protein 585A-like isoform X2 [Zootermopsis nevadensis]
MSGASENFELEAGSSGMMESSVMEGEEYYNPEGSEWSQKVDTGQLCRVCANANDYLIPIFDGEGLEHELGMKIEKHLPIKVTETDSLPQQMCYQCASTLIAWHDLVISCVEADKKLRELQVEDDDDDDGDDKGAEMFESPSLDAEMTDDAVQPSTSEVQSQVSKTPSPKKILLNKEKKPKLKMVLVKGHAAGTSGQKTSSKTQVAKALELAKSKDGSSQDSASERCQQPPQTPFKTFQEQNEMNMAGPRNTADALTDNGLVKNECTDSKDAWLTCDYCGHISAKKAELIIHISTVHPQELASLNIPAGCVSGSELECKSDVCEIKDCMYEGHNGRSFGKSRLGKVKHSAVANQQFPCSVCGRFFKRKSDACRHVEKHKLQDFVFKNVESLAGDLYGTSDSGLATENVQEFPDSEHLKSCLVEIRRNYENSLGTSNEKTNDSVICGKNKSFSCYVCGRKLTRKHDLLRHLKMHAKKLGSFVSSDVNYYTAGSIKKMVSGAQSGDRSSELSETDIIQGYPCHVCGRVLRGTFDLRRPLRKHSRKPDQVDGEFFQTLSNIGSGDDIPSGSLSSGNGPVSTLLEANDDSIHGSKVAVTEFVFNNERKTDLLCNICSKMLTRKYYLHRHLITHSKKQYLYSDDRLSDMGPAFVDGNAYSCSGDDAHLENSDGKTSTFDIHTSQNFSCSVCSKSFTRRFDLKRHAERHSSEDVDKIVSLKSSTDNVSLASAKVVIEGKTLYRCEHCCKYLMTRYSYVRHLRIHSGEKPCTCHVCGKQFRTSALLNRHVRDVHEGIKEHPCDICGRKFANKRAMLDHRRVHTGERPCVCHVCGKAFKTKASLYVHNLFHMDVFPHQCIHCNKSFRRRQQLNVHLLLHTGEKPHCCQTCGKCFRMRKSLKRHVLTHTNEKPFECLVCGQLFAQERYLKNHGKTHGIGINNKITA